MALGVILSPALAVIGTAGILLAINHRIPIAVPLLLLLCIPLISLAWLSVVSVRTSSAGIATTRPWRSWAELPWELIERAKSDGIRITLISSEGQRITFVPYILREGARLRREVLVRLPAQVLDDRLLGEARALLADQVVPKPDGGLSGSIDARPRSALRILAIAVACVAVAAGTTAVLLRHDLLGMSIAVLAFAVFGAMLGAYFWLMQRIEVSDAGIHVTHVLARHSQVMAWSEVHLLEHTPAERIIRLRGDVRLRCAGPALLRRTERDVMRAFLNAYCIERGVPVVQRLWLI